MLNDREKRTREIISRIRISKGKAELKAIEELKELYFDIIEKRVKKVIYKYKDIGSEKYDGEITQIYEDIFKSAAKNFDSQANDNFKAYLVSGWKRFQAEKKVLDLLHKIPHLPPNPKRKQDYGDYDPISNLQDDKNYHNLNTAEFNMLMSDLSLSFDVSTDLILSIVSGHMDSCKKRVALNKMARMVNKINTSINTDLLLGSAFKRRNWWIGWA